MKMKKFKLYCKYEVYGEAVVEAENEAEAREKVEFDEWLIETIREEDWEAYGIEEVKE